MIEMQWFCSLASSDNDVDATNVVASVTAAAAVVVVVAAVVVVVDVAVAFVVVVFVVVVIVVVVIVVVIVVVVAVGCCRHSPCHFEAARPRQFLVVSYLFCQLLQMAKIISRTFLSCSSHFLHLAQAKVSYRAEEETKPQLC